MDINVLHVTNTDVIYDSRILKELDSLNQLEFINVRAIGIATDDRADFEINKRIIYHRIRLKSRILKKAPRAIRYSLELLEFTFKCVKYGLVSKPVVVHCHDAFALPAGVILKKLLGCDLIYDAHELESNKNGQNFLLSKATLIIERVSWRSVDAFITVSESIINWYALHFGKKPSYLVLNSPVTIQKNRTYESAIGDKKYFHNIYNIEPDKLVFVYVGILDPGRGIELIINAFSKIENAAHVVLIGDGKLTELVKSSCETHKNIHYHEPVPHEMVVPLIKNANVGICLIENVSLSDFYCLPNKLFEYCFSGLFVLASDFPEIKKTIENYRLGVCCKPEPESVLLSINNIIQKAPENEQLDLAVLSWESQANRLKNCYRTLLGV